MELITLASNITNAAMSIDSGRKGFAVMGKEREGRINYEDGIANAMSLFQQAQTAADPQALILAEYTFISQELQFCDKTDKDSINSLTKAIESFNDAFLALQVVDEKSQYQVADKVIPHDKKYRVSGRPLLSLKASRHNSHTLASSGALTMSHSLPNTANAVQFLGYPKDSFHIACISHKTRIQNILRTPGLDPIEKALLKQRLVNLSVAQGGYVEKQKKALINEKIANKNCFSFV